MRKKERESGGEAAGEELRRIAEEAQRESDAAALSALPESLMGALGRAAAERAVEMFRRCEREERERAREARLHSTKLLLKKYRWLKGFSAGAVSDLSQVLSREEQALLAGMGLETRELRRVESIREGVVFTDTVLAHVDAMLRVYEERCGAGGEEAKRRWRTVKSLYLDEPPLTAEEIAEREYVAARTVWRDADAAAQELSGLIFGLDLWDLLGPGPETPGKKVP